jgi:hypothetical protein
MAGMFGMTKDWRGKISPSGKQNKTMRQLINEFKMRGKKGDDQVRDTIIREIFYC